MRKMNTSAITSKISEPEIKLTILLAVVAFQAPLLMCLSWRQRQSGQPVLRFLLWGVSAAYFKLMTAVLSLLTAYTPSDKHLATSVLVLVLVVLVLFIRAKADMAAMSVAAVVASPAAGGDDGVNGLKIRPSTDQVINTFWVAGLVIYNVYKFVNQNQATRSPPPAPPDADFNVPPSCTELLVYVTVLIAPVWFLGVARTLLSFFAFRWATSSMALGRNVHLIDGYMLQLREGLGGGCFEFEGEAAAAVAAVPRLIVTGERDQDVVESPVGYRVKLSALQDEGSPLVTLDQVWNSSSSAAAHRVDGGRLLLQQEHKDLCLSFALFKCLRRRFAGYRLTAEAGSSWAFRFVRDGLLGPEDDHGRIFRVIATELSFASDFFHSSLPVASLGTMAAALHFVFYLVNLLSLLLLTLLILVALAWKYSGTIPESLPYEWKCSDEDKGAYPLAFLALALTPLNACMEIWEMLSSVRSNWTKISIIGHLVRSRHHCARRFFACLLRWKARKFWKDEIRQVQLQLLKPAAGLPCMQQSWARQVSLGARRLLGLCIIQRRNSKVPLPQEVKEAILESFRRSGGHLSDGTSAIRHHGFSRDDYDITWACRDGGCVLTTTTDAILVWHIATTLFDLKCSWSSSTSTSSSTSKVVACSLSRYCAYLVAEAPDLLPDNPAWTTRRYEAVKKGIEEAWSSKRSGDVSLSCVYQQLVDTFAGGKNSHEVLDKGSRLAKQLVEEAERRQRSHGEGGGGGEAGGQDAVWELLSDFWSEMLLYIAPSDSVNGHIEALQRGGELITLLRALLQHAGVTSRPVQFNFTATVLSTGDPADTNIDVLNC